MHHIDSLTDGSGISHGSESIINAAIPGEGQNPGDYVLIFRVDGMRRAEVSRRVEFIVENVDRDNHGSTAQHGTLDCVYSDTAGADHGDSAASFYLCRVGDGAQPGNDAAGQ